VFSFNVIPSQDSKLRVLSAGDKVLVISPKPKNKLDFIWKGPAKVIETRDVVNYRINFDSGTERTYNINMLKKFIGRQSEVSVSHDRAG